MRQVPRNSEVNPLRSTVTGWYGRNYRLGSSDQTRHEDGLDCGPALLPAIRFNRAISKERVEIKKRLQRPHEISISTLKKRMTMLEEYQIREKIGEGAFAEVFVAVDPRTTEKVVIKMYDKFKIYDKQRKQNLKNQIAVLKRLSHPNIIELLETVQTSKSINLVMEHFSVTNLRKLVGTNKLSEQDIRKIIKQLAEGLQYLHEQGIAHRDIKMENVLVDEQMNVKLIDFGFAVEYKGLTDSTVVGTPNYICPEQLVDKQYDPQKADVWALGILLYYLMTGYFPFRGETKQLYKRIGKGQVLFPHDFNPSCEYLLRKMLNPSHEQRVSASEVLKDTWVKPVNFREQISLLERAIKKAQ